MLLLVVAALCITIGVATEVALHAYLIGKTDKQLEEASARTGAEARSPYGGRMPRNGRPDPIGAQGLGSGTLAATLVDGAVEYGAFFSSRPGPPDQLGPDTYPVLEALPADGEPHNREVPGLGRYRLLATELSDGRVIITGLPIDDVYDTLERLAYVEIGVSLLALLAAGLGGSALIRVTLKPLNRVAATAGRVAELPLHEGDVALAERVPEIYTDPRTEVGQVGAALNRMLGHVAGAFAARQASETRLRKFVADASHELRTPLAAIRGYAEPGRREGVDAEPVLIKVETQAKRMTALVEDLLLLARLDAGRPLERGPVDLTALVVESVGDAHVAGPEHRWRLDLPDEPVVVAGDAARLHQVLANLLANARTHTPPGTEVTVRITPAGELSVTDNGPGIPAELQPNLFQRFTRGDSSRARAAGGSSTGLGLSIVDAVVRAHGGDVRVDSVPGRTAFTVTLPRYTDSFTAAAQDGHTIGIAGTTNVDA
ncbi:HAMP domain-containing sensor histidine kinase [Virgisporangium ochraceum]